MIEGSIWKSMLLFAVPLLVGNLFQQLYNTVDSYVVGNYVDTSALAAVGSSVSIINMLVGIFTGLSAGAGVVISRYFGGRRKEEMSAAVHCALALTLVLSAVFTVVGVAFTEILLKAIGVPEDVLPHATLYLKIYFGGIVFSLIYNIGAGILRAVGDSRNPLIYLVAACVVNIVLDFAFVCGLGWGIAGVGIATVIAQAVSSVMVMYQLTHTNEDYQVRWREIRFHRGILHQITGIGFPTAFQQSITSFSNVIVQSYINSFGTAAIAGYSTANRVEGFFFLILQSFSMTVITFVGQNIGADQYKRVKQGVWTAWFMGTCIVLVGATVMNVCGMQLVSLFTEDAEVIAIGGDILKVFSYGYPLLPVVHILGGTFQGVGKAKVPMYFMLGTFVVLRQIYLLIVVPMADNVLPVMAGWPITWVICAIGMLIYYFKTDWMPKNE